MRFSRSSALIVSVFSDFPELYLSVLHRVVVVDDNVGAVADCQSLSHGESRANICGVNAVTHTVYVALMS